jgi:hypothetical protein
MASISRRAGRRAAIRRGRASGENRAKGQVVTSVAAAHGSRALYNWYMDNSMAVGEHSSAMANVQVAAAFLAVPLYIFGVLCIWDYSSLTEPVPYGEETTYGRGLGWLKDCRVVEDWGCGPAWGRRFVPEGHYVGIDSSPSKFIDKLCDLRDYHSDADGIFIRHVLEHNHDWRKILQNAVESFTKRLVLVIFTPFSEKTHPIVSSKALDISFRKEDLDRFFTDFAIKEEHLRTKTQYSEEHIFYVEKEALRVADT